MARGRRSAKYMPHKRPAGRRPVGVRIIGGRLRGRKLEYSGDLRTRPMKDRVREALFNLLGRAVDDKVAIDLFAGTGALAIEALSRGALRAILIERHRATAEAIRRNAAMLGVDALAEVITADTFLWAKSPPDLDPRPWLVFCSPPYDFYISRKTDLLGLLHHLIEISPPGSLLVVEADDRFDFRELPDADHWDIRAYPPTVLGIWEKQVV